MQLSEEDLCAVCKFSATSEIPDGIIDIANAAFALGVERASKSPDAATRAVIERLTDVTTFLLDIVEKVALGPVAFRPSIADPREAIAEARKLLEGDALAQPADEDAWLVEARELLSRAMFASASNRGYVEAGDAVMAHLRTRPAREGFVSVLVEPTEAQWDAAWLELQTGSDFKGIRAKLSAYEVRAIFTMLHKAMIEAAKGDGK